MISRRVVWQPMTVATLAAVAVSTAHAGGPPASPGLTTYEARTSALLDRAAVRQKIARSTMLFDGDGTTQDRRKWVDSMFTVDAVLQVYDAQKLLVSETIGRESIFAVFGATPAYSVNVDRTFSGETVFDEVTPTRIKTRTIVMQVRGQRFPPFTQQLPIASYVYHDTWVKTSSAHRGLGVGPQADWVKSRSEIRCWANCWGFQ